MQKEIAILAGGCFWGMQELLRKFPGVISTRVGYTGGDVPNATYHKHGTHAEAVEVVFDADVISYRGLLKYFFKIHDPTTLDRQGNDVGSSYRSEIFYASSKQKEIALELIKDLEASGIWPGKIVTKVSKASDFWEAEEYHQDYLQKNPNGYTCHFERDEWVLSKKYDLNRSDIIIESIRSYIQAQEEREFYESFDKSCKDLKEVLEDSSKSKKFVSIEELLDEL